MPTKAAAAGQEEMLCTFLEESWGEVLSVPFHSYDDSSVLSFGNCKWTHQIPSSLNRLLYVSDWELRVYKDAYSYERQGMFSTGDIIVADGAPFPVHSYIDIYVSVYVCEGMYIHIGIPIYRRIHTYIGVASVLINDHVIAPSGQGHGSQSI